MLEGLGGAGVKLVVGFVGSSGKLWYTLFITAVSIKVSTPCFSVWRLLCKSVAADCVGFVNQGGYHVGYRVSGWVGASSELFGSVADARGG